MQEETKDKPTSNHLFRSYYYADAAEFGLAATASNAVALSVNWLNLKLLKSGSRSPHANRGGRGTGELIGA